MPTSTSNYSFQLPTVGLDSDVWGALLNTNFSELDVRFGNTFFSPIASGSGRDLGTLRTSKLPTELGTGHTITGSGTILLTIHNSTSNGASVRYVTTSGARYMGFKDLNFVIAEDSDLTVNRKMVLDGATAWFAGVLTGDGSGLTNVPVSASNISGTISPSNIVGSYGNFSFITGTGVARFAKFRVDAGPDAGISSNEEINTGFRWPTGTPHTIYVTNSSGAVTMTFNNSGITLQGGRTFAGSGADLTNVPAGQLTGTVSTARLPTDATADGWVRDRIAGSDYGYVGTLAFLLYTGTAATDPGMTRPGTDLRYTTANGDNVAGSPGGTWRCLGRTIASGTNAQKSTLWLRIN